VGGDSGKGGRRDFMNKNKTKEDKGQKNKTDGDKGDNKGGKNKTNETDGDSKEGKGKGKKNVEAGGKRALFELP